MLHSGIEFHCYSRLGSELQLAVPSNEANIRDLVDHEAPPEVHTEGFDSRRLDGREGDVIISSLQAEKLVHIVNCGFNICLSG